VIEFELKFKVDANRREAVEAAVERGRSYRKRLRARYFDTADGALAARRIVLRLRKEEGSWIQTAKAPTGDPLARHEHNVELPPMRASEVPLPDLARHRGSPVGALIDKALRQAGLDPETAELVPLYGTDVWRTTREMHSGDALVELAFDVGSVRAGDRSHALCELEMELKHGSPAAMLELCRRWCTRYGLWLDTVSKSAQGERLAQGIVHAAPLKAVAPRIEPKTPAPEVFRRVLSTCLQQILANASEVGAGSSDPEHVHQLRVGIRRLRTALRELADLAPHIDPRWEPALVDAFQALGRQRDRELVQQTVQAEARAHGGPAFGFHDDSDGEPTPAEVVRSAAFQAVLMDLIVAALPPAPPSPSLTAAPAHAASVGDRTVAPSAAKADKADKNGKAAKPAKADAPPHKLLRLRLDKLHRQVLHDGKRFESLAPAEQHRVRKRLKRLRYLGEFVAPLYGRRAAERFLAMLEPAQDALGAHNDAVVAMAVCRASAAHDGGAWFAVGWLAARHADSAAGCRRALEKLADAKPFWRDA